MPAFDTDLDWCKVSYSYSVTEEQGASVISFDTETLTFSFENKDDLILSGLNAKSYRISITGITG